jgi:hypothetical protein
MHGESIVAIETEVGDLNLADFPSGFVRGEADEVVAFRTKTRAEFGHSNCCLK